MRNTDAALWANELIIIGFRNVMGSKKVMLSKNGFL